MKAVSPRQVTRFVPSCDKKLPADEQTVFVIKPLSVEEELILDDAQWRTDAEGKRSFSFSSRLLMALHLGVISVENFFDKDGNAIVIDREEFKDDFGVNRIEDEFLQQIPKKIRDEVSLFVVDGTTPTEKQRKN